MLSYLAGEWRSLKKKNVEVAQCSMNLNFPEATERTSEIVIIILHPAPSSLRLAPCFLYFKIRYLEKPTASLKASPLVNSLRPPSFAPRPAPRAELPSSCGRSLESRRCGRRCRAYGAFVYG